MTISKRATALIRGGLLAFVLITLGFMLGKEAGLRAAGERTGTTAPVASSDESETGPVVVVTYAHTTFRCVTCNTIERLAHEVITSRFAEELEQGKVAWRVVNFQEDEAFARRYEIASSTVVVTTRRDGEEQHARRLDEVWTLVNDRPGFDRYVGDAVAACLAETERRD